MKKIFLFCIGIICSITLSAQEKVIVYQGQYQIYYPNVTDVDSIKFSNGAAVFHLNNGLYPAFYFSQIDSVVFKERTEPDKIYITYNGNTVDVVNPYSHAGITIIVETATVRVEAFSGIENVHYVISGTSNEGMLSLTSDMPLIMELDSLTLSNTTNHAISINSNIAAQIILTDNNILTDNATSAGSAVLTGKGDMLFTGSGALQVTAKKKHAISSSKKITVSGGNFTIPAAVSDGFHSEGFDMFNGSIQVAATGDGIDAGGEPINIYNGAITVNSTANDVKAIKSDANLTINGGTLNCTVSGAQSKGISSKSNIAINGGNIDIVTSGNVVLETSGSGYDPSYCTAIKADSNIVVNGGAITIQSQSGAAGGKGLSSDRDVIVNGGTLYIITAGNGAVYTNENGATDSYTACCIKADNSISLLGGNITCQSSGSGGKCVAADNKLTIGVLGADNNNLHITASTSGERFYVSGNSGGGPGGDNADYANPKAIKAESTLTVNSGIIRITCTQTQEGGEGMESKDTLIINGGDIEISTYDDCINAANHIKMVGGNVYLSASNNDAMDSNGTLFIGGGFVIGNGTRAPEEGFDCDNNQFRITGGTIIGTGGATSTPTASVSTQYSIKYTGTAGNAICIKNAANETVLLYQMPTFQGGGGPGGPGGGNSMIVLFSAPSLAPGSYTLQYGGSITGGANYHGYNTGGSYSGGSTKNFTISGKVTTVQ